MISPVKELHSAAMRLAPAERAQLVEMLVASLEIDEDVERAWIAEVERRIGDHDAGRTAAIPASEVFAELRARSG